MHAAAKPPISRQRRIGRLIVLGVFFVGAGYLVVSVVTSVVLSLYGKPPSAHAGALSEDDRSYCVRALVGLRDELEEQMTLVAQPPKPGVDAKARWERWDASFRGRFDDASMRCVRDDAGMEHAYEALIAMHDGYAGAASRIFEVRSLYVPAIADVEQLLNDD